MNGRQSLSIAVSWWNSIHVAYKVAVAVIAIVTLILSIQRRVEGITSIPSKIDTVHEELHHHMDSTAYYAKQVTEGLRKIYCVTAYETSRDQKDCLLGAKP